MFNKTKKCVMCGKDAEYISKKNREPLCEMDFNIDCWLFESWKKVHWNDIEWRRKWLGE